MRRKSSKEFLKSSKLVIKGVDRLIFKRKPVFILFIKYVILTNMKGGCFSTLSLHRSLHALHSVYGRRDRSGFSSMCRYVTISNHSTFSPYPSKYQTNRCHNLTCKDETSDIQKSKLKRKIFPQYPHESPTCPEEEPDQERRGLTQTDNRVSVIYI